MRLVKDGWKKVEEQKKLEKSSKKSQTIFCLESAGDGLGTFVGVPIAPKKYYSDRITTFSNKKSRNLTVVLRIDSYESN